MPWEEVLRDTTALGGIALYGFVAVLFLLLGNATVFQQLLIGIVLLYALVAVIRLVFFRRRPDRQRYTGFFTKIDAGSFPSMHSARATVLALVLSQAFKNPLVCALLALSVLAVVATRVMLKRHYVSDVVGGIIVGLAVGIITEYATAHVVFA